MVNVVRVLTAAAEAAAVPATAAAGISGPHCGVESRCVGLIA